MSRRPVGHGGNRNRAAVARAVVAGAVLAIVACGGDDDTGEPAIQPEGEADLVGAYDVAYQVCEGIAAVEVDPDPAIAADPDLDEEGYAAGWAAQYEPPFKDVYRDGCVDGFEGRPMNPPG